MKLFKSPTLENAGTDISLLILSAFQIIPVLIWIWLYLMFTHTGSTCLACSNRFM